MPTLSLTDQTRISAAKEQLTSELAGEAVILNLKTGVYFGLDPVGARIWKLLEEPKTLPELVTALLAEYEVDAARLEADVLALLDQLDESQLIEIT